MNTIFLRNLLVLFSAVATSSIHAGKGVLYHNDFEARNDISFRACYKPWISNLKKAERGGYIKVKRADITGQNEGKSHSGVRSFVLDMTIDKSDSRWGGRCYWNGPKMNIPLNKDVFLSGYILPETLPPDLEIGMGVIFNAVAKKKRTAGKRGSLDHQTSGKRQRRLAGLS